MTISSQQTFEILLGKPHASANIFETIFNVNSNFACFKVEFNFRKRFIINFVAGKEGVSLGRTLFVCLVLMGDPHVCFTLFRMIQQEFQDGMMPRKELCMFLHLLEKGGLKKCNPVLGTKSKIHYLFFSRRRLVRTIRGSHAEGFQKVIIFGWGFLD